LRFSFNNVEPANSAAA